MIPMRVLVSLQAVLDGLDGAIELVNGSEEINIAHASSGLQFIVLS